MPENPLQLFDLTVSDAIQNPIYQGAAGILLFLILLFALMRMLKQDLILAFSDKEGAVQITPNALQELVRSSCETLPDVHSPSTKIIRKANKVHLQIRLRADADRDIKESRVALKARIEEVLVKNLGLRNFGGIDVIVKGFRKTE